jgi:hypothetical protein
MGTKRRRRSPRTVCRGSAIRYILLREMAPVLWKTVKKDARVALPPPKSRYRYLILLTMNVNQDLTCI